MKSGTLEKFLHMVHYVRGKYGNVYIRFIKEKYTTAKRGKETVKTAFCI